MASPIDICNTALSLLGADTIVASIAPPDGSVEAGHCARFYPLARRQMIDLGEWAFTKTRIALAEVDNDSESWAYAYSLPTGCINAKRILMPNAAVNDLVLSDPFTSTYVTTVDESAGAPFEVDGEVIRTNEAEAVLIYTVDVEDTSKFPASFVMALSTLLAAYLAGPIIKGTAGINIGRSLRQEANEAAAKSSAGDTNNSTVVNEPLPASLRARR